jgi:hypothetical protein
MKSANKPRFIPYEDLRSRYGETRGRQQIRDAVKAGKYPAARQISPQRIAWETSELDAYYDACPRVTYGRKERAA